MKHFALVTILGLVVAYLAPTLMSHIYFVPHTHVLVGNVSAADMRAHLESERAEQNSAARETRLNSGFILSIPFATLASFLSGLGMCLLVSLGEIGVVAFCTRMLIHSPRRFSPTLSPAIPPPRAA